MPTMLSIPGFCRWIGISRTHFYRLPPEDRPATIRLGKRVVIPQSAVEDWEARMLARNATA